MNRALGVLSIVTLFLMSVAIAQADEAESSWNDYIETKFINEVGYDIAVNPCGNTPCVVGWTSAEDFPTTAGAFDISYNFGSDAIITKFNSSGSVLLYSTVLGGADVEFAFGISMDDSGNVYLTGQTWSTDFPVTPGSFDTTHNGRYDAFISKLNVTGTSLIYSTFLGGAQSETGQDIENDEKGNVYVTGSTESESFPTTIGAFDRTYNGGIDVFAAKLDPAGKNLEYGTFIGGDDDDWGMGIATLGQTGRIFITGLTKSSNFPVTANSLDTTHNGDRDIFVTCLNVSENFLDYSTFIGGSRSDVGNDIAKDRFGSVYVVGDSRSDNFPTVPGALSTTLNGERDVVIFKLSPTGHELLFSTFLGGKDFDYGESIAIDNGGYTYVTGYTYSDDFPISEGAFDTTYNGDGDAFIAKLTPSGRILSYSTYLGNWSVAYGIDIDQYGYAYVTGTTGTSNFPTTPGVFDTTFDGREDIFLTKLNIEGTSLIFSTFLGGEEWIPMGVADLLIQQTPNDFVLHPNFPNPFNASTEIRYQLSQDADVSLRIYNVAGQTVRTLADTKQPAGEYAVAWDGNDDAHQEVASGIYFCRFQAGDAAETIKMVLVR